MLVDYLNSCQGSAAALANVPSKEGSKPASNSAARELTGRETFSSVQGLIDVSHQTDQCLLQPGKDPGMLS